MRSAPALIFALIFAPALIAAHAHASVCESAKKGATPQRWEIDRYIYDASLKQDWEVLVDCDHPAAPGRMKLTPNTSGHPQIAKPAPSPSAPPVIKVGGTVEVASAPGSRAAIRLSGTALETAFAGQPIRVRLSAGNRLVTGLVRGPHSVELAAASRPRWSEQ